MNWTDRAELDELRQGMWEIFSKMAKIPDHIKEIEKFVELMDRHQEILSGSVD